MSLEVAYLTGYDQLVATAKVSATLDQKLLAQVRRRVGPRGLSSFVNQAIAEKLQRERVLELLDNLEAEHGPPTAEELETAKAELAKVLRGARAATPTSTAS